MGHTMPTTRTGTRRQHSHSHSHSSAMARSSMTALPGRMLIVITSLLVLLMLAVAPAGVQAVKFDLVASHNPQQRCIWNYAMADTLVVITANIAKGENQRVDMEVVDGSNHRRPRD